MTPFITIALAVNLQSSSISFDLPVHKNWRSMLMKDPSVRRSILRLFQMGKVGRKENASATPRLRTSLMRSIDKQFGPPDF